MKISILYTVFLVIEYSRAYYEIPLGLAFIQDEKA